MDEKQNPDQLIGIYLLMDKGSSFGNRGFEPHEEFAGEIEAKKIFTPEALRLLEPFLNKKTSCDFDKRKIIGYRVILFYDSSVDEYMQRIHLYESSKRKIDYNYNPSGFDSSEGVP